MPLVRELLDRSKMAIAGMGISPVSRLCLRMTLTSLWHDDARLDGIVPTKWLLVQLRQHRAVLEVVGKLLGDVVRRHEALQAWDREQARQHRVFSVMLLPESPKN
jgi:hypothetical protein